MTNHDRPLGEVLRRGDQLGLCYERVLRHPLERVWRALTDSDDLRYWMPCYHVCLDQLIELLHEGVTGPLDDADVKRWEKEYSEAVAKVG